LAFIPLGILFNWKIDLTFILLFPGNIETKSLSPNVISRNVALRNELDLFVNVLHCYSFPGIDARHKDVDIHIIRQNTEGEYAMQEHEVHLLISLSHASSY